MSGFIEVLAVGKGDEKIELTQDGSENKNKVDDLLKKGYLLSVMVGDNSESVSGFDAESNSVIAKQEIRIPANEAKITAVAPIAGG